MDEMLLDFTRWIHNQQESVSKDALTKVLLDMGGKGGVVSVVNGINCRRSRHRLHSLGQRPSLSTLLNLAALKGVSIQGVLGDAQSWLPDHLFESDFEFQDFIPRSYERSKYSSAQIATVIRYLLKSGLPLPPTSLIWQAMEIASVSAKNALPDAYATLLKRARSEHRLLQRPKMRAGTQILSDCLSESGRLPRLALTEKLVGVGYTDAEAELCLDAALNLRQALRMASQHKQG
ncbi:MAG: hypothetical protein Q4F49_05720 [Pseudoxanthomonas suwonensis]|nr:hypothetical protein [Pseudoxanthomonas suwonensis]